jgi:chromosomal replication initiator protein
MLSSSPPARSPGPAHAVAPVHPDPTATWSRISDELRAAVPPAMYDIWLAPLQLVELDGAEVVVEAPPELQAWIADRFQRVLQTSAAAVLGPEAAVHVRAGAAGAAPKRAARPAPEDDGPDDEHEERLERLNPKCTFDQFVIGDANRFAHAAALAVSELPGQAYTPLFLYGPPGVGKTHLLHAIGNYIERFGGGLAVRVTTAETFTNAFVSALRGKALGRFKSRYRATDVLLIDDVQFLAAKARTMEEFFHTFNALQAGGAQIVVTSDRTPDDLELVDERLRARFAAGLVTQIAAPDRATRLAVLRKRAHSDGIVLAEEAVLDLIADRVPSNVRALEGALIRVVAFASLTGRPIDASLTDDVLDELYPRRPRAGEPRAAAAAPPSIESVQDATAAAFALTREDLLSSSRAPALVWPRQLAMYLAREHTGASLPAIAARFGKNHTTVMHACKRAAERLREDAEARACAQAIVEGL